MNCSEYKSALHAYFSDQLGSPERAAVEAHAGTCDDCGTLMRIACELSCRDFVEFMNRYIDGELEQERREVFDRHLSICENCTNYLEGYKRTMELSVVALLGGGVPPPPPVPEALVRAILDARR